MNETSTENPSPPVPQDAPQSPRNTWPKTKQERAIAKTLVRQCYTLAHDEHEQINWKAIKEQHPELYGQLRYWSADVDIRIQQLAHTMRDEGDLPEIVRVSDERHPGRETHARFSVFDNYVKDNYKTFPRDDRGRVAWDEVKNSFPEFWRICEGLWGEEFAAVRGNASGRVRQLGIGTKPGKRKSKPHHRNNGTTTNGAEHDAVDKWLIENWNNLPRQKTGGRVSWKQSQYDNPELWQLLRRLWPNWNDGSYRNGLNKKIAALGLIWDGNPKGKNKRHVRAMVHHPIVHRREEPPLPQVRVDQPAPPVEGANAVPFKFEACPKCYAPLGLLEKMLGAPIIECPKCGFNVLLAEQGVTAAFSLPKEQHSLEQILNQ